MASRDLFALVVDTIQVDAIARSLKDGEHELRYV
jgi:hypothetical protein